VSASYPASVRHSPWLLGRQDPNCTIPPPCAAIPPGRQRRKGAGHEG
jgi:hypothetical protein